ncbi:MAG: DNA internalization-related competence protein ComEC/Rec2 [Clostridia bacterium]|nr:DNA internalization-related competence protein ComEC/Rec2 [Clostridia bacterium]
MKRAFLITGISALGFLLGAEYIDRYYISWILLFTAVAGLISVAVRYILGRKKDRKDKPYPKAKSLFEILIAACVSVSLCGTVYVYNLDRYNSVIEQYSGQTLECKLQIVSEEKFSDSGYGYFEAKSVSGIDTKGFSVRVFSSGLPEAEVYDCISGKFEFSSSDDEYKLLNRSSRIVLTSFAENVTVEPVTERPFWFKIIELRRFIGNAITSNFGKAHGFIKALLLGNRTDLTSEEFDSLKNSGLLHVTAVSGLHVSIAASFVLALFSFIKKRWVRYLSVFLALSVLVSVTGFSPSVIRAVFMICAGYAGSLMLRKADALNLLGAILTACLVVSPFSAHSASLLLSFSSTAGLILFANPLQTAITTWWFKWKGKYVPKFFKWIISTFSVSMACTVFSVPVSMVLFDNFSAAGLLTNLLCLWLIKYIFILASVTVALSVFAFLEPFFTVVSLVLNWSVNYIMKISDLFSETFLSELEAQPLTMLLAAIIGFVVYLLMGTKSSKKKRKKQSKQVGRIAAAVIVAVVVLISTSVAGKLATPHDDKLHTVFVDVGQGLGTYISINEKAVIFDCGGSKDAGESMNESLWEHGIKEIDYIVISHLHDDHANGIAEIFAEWEIDEVIVPYTEGDPSILVELMMLAAEEGAEVVTISEDMSREFGEAKIKLLTKHLDPESSDQNENSIVSVVSYSNFSVMFTGDITSEAEERLIEAYGLSLRTKILTVPHHGSKYSSSEEFLAMVSPEISVISVGKNSYGHPADAVLDKLLKYGNVLTTQTLGEIEFITDGVETEQVK